MEYQLKIGFTGTQVGMTDKQKQHVYSSLSRHINGNTLIPIKDRGVPLITPEFHFGDCIGADEESAEMAEKLNYILVSHPPTNDLKRAFCNYDIQLAPKPYLQRNHDIVDEVNIMIATPKEDKEQLRSGTWATIRYTKKMNKGLTIIMPDGQIYTQWRQI